MGSLVIYTRDVESERTKQRREDFIESVHIFLYLSTILAIVYTFRKIQENAIFIAVLIGIITIVFLAFSIRKKRLLKREYRSSCEALALSIAGRHNGRLSVPLFSLESSLRLDECDRIVRDLEEKGVFRSIINTESGTIYHLDPYILQSLERSNQDSDQDNDDECDSEWDEEDEDDDWDDDDDWNENQKQMTKKNHAQLLNVIVPKSIRENKVVRFFTAGNILVKVLLVLLIVLFDLVDKHYILEHAKIYIVATSVSLSFFILLGISSYVQSNKTMKRMREIDIMDYIFEKEGYLYQKEIAAYTYESIDSVQPTIQNWFKNRYASIHTLDDGSILYYFPEITDQSVINQNRSFFSPMEHSNKLIIQFMQYTMLACLLSGMGGYVADRYGMWVFGIAWGIIFLLALGTIASQVSTESERMERMGFQVAEQKGGALTIHEFAYGAGIRMEEAAQILRKWEQEELARSMEHPDQIPYYKINGVLSMEQRLSSEYV
ncbi:hypothetical protein [Brevibacillus laterosporus]|uniref:hypothetical protein n=1 Tax=Brevibacillus laterosporus TaxID=1465 RepID=UPI003D1F10FC|nr:hypothetical protein [Brevibacillus laterosporus]